MINYILKLIKIELNLNILKLLNPGKNIQLHLQIIKITKQNQLLQKCSRTPTNPDFSHSFTVSGI